MSEKVILVELVECLSATVAECSNSLEAMESRMRFQLDAQRKEFASEHDRLSQRIVAMELKDAKHEELIAGVTRELARIKQTVLDQMHRFVTKAIVSNNETLQEINHREKIELIEGCHERFVEEIDKLRRAVKEWRYSQDRFELSPEVTASLVLDDKTQSVSNNPALSFADKCAELIKATKQTRTRLEHMNVT